MRAKHLFITLLLALCGLTVAAQDIIITTGSERIEAQITEVSDEAVRYKKANNPNGPTFVIKMENIATIIYQNGDVQAINHNDIPTDNNANIADAYAADMPVQADNHVAQENPSQGRELSHPVRLSIGFANLGEKDKGGTTNFAGFYAGASVNIKIKKFTDKYVLGIAPGAYIDLNFKSVDMGLATRNMFQFNLRIPVLATFTYNINQKMRAGAYLGPSFNIGLMAEDKDKGPYTNSGTNFYVDDILRRFHAGLSFGFIYEIKRFSVNMGYEIGLTNRFTKNAGYSFSLHDNLFSVGIGYRP